MATESNTNSTTKLEEQAGVSGKSKVTKKCLIFEKLIKENISQAPVQRVTKTTNEVKKGLETQHQHAGHVPSSHQEDQVLEQGPETQHQHAGHVPSSHSALECQNCPRRGK